MMMKKIQHSLFALSACALAQSPLVIAADSSGGKVTYEEIVVTAQKREQRLIDVPMSISAISGDDLEQKGINDVQDLTFAVPGMSAREDGPGSYNIFMRGLANTDSSGALVGVYIDESPLTLSGYDQLDIRPIDLERVEVLKGPQGTLYGQGSISGTVRYITAKPDLNEFSGSLSATLANVDDGDAKKVGNLVLNVPVVEDVFALRFAGTIERDGGWQDQPAAGISDGNGADLEHFRVKALWQASEALQIDAMVLSHNAEYELGLGYEQPDRTVAVAIDPARRLIPKKLEYTLYSLNFSYEFGFADLISASTYIDYDHEYPFTYFGTTETIYGGELEGTDARFQDGDMFSQEVRLVSSGEGPLHWTLGGFYRDVEIDFFAVFDTLFGGAVFPDATFISDTTSESYAVFADLSYDINERLTAGVGIRYFEDEQSTFDGADIEKDTFDSVDPRVYLSYALSDTMNTYVNIGKGFRSGGFNAGALPNYDPESVTSYELGIKGSALDNVINFEAAIFYTEYEDMLRRGLVFVSPAFVSLTSNIGEVEVTGFEFGVTWNVTSNLSLNATGTVVDSEVVSINSTDATNQEGDPVDYVADYSYTLGANYAFSWGDGMPGYVRLDYSYRDEVNYVDRTSFPAENLPQKSDDIALLNARVGMEWDKLSIELFGTNITNTNDYIDPYIGWNNANRTRPRILGAKVGYQF